MGRLRVLVVAVVVGVAGVVAPLAPSAPVAAAVDPAPVIDPMSRASVWNAYQTSLVEPKGVPTGWTGSTSSCTEGTESAASITATRAALNFFRGLVGLPGLTNNAAGNADAMRAALIQAANPAKAPSHHPDNTWACWTQARDDASENHNLSSLPGAAGIELYVTDPGAGNDWAGHRRWVMHPRGTTFSTGSTSTYNALDVQTGGSVPAGVEWISWPNAGFVPKAVLRPYGSFWTPIQMSLTNALQNHDYSAASVSVKIGSTSLPVTVNVPFGSYLTWYVEPPAGWDSSGEATFDITVSGIKTEGGAAVPTRSWSSTAILSGSTATAPGAPTGVTATRGNGQATVSWTAPASNGGSAITGYKVTPYIGGTAQPVRTFNSTATSQAITGLTNGTAYTFRVRAVNAIGDGTQSAASAAVTPATTPGAPTGITAGAGSGQVTVGWTAPASTGGSAITGYKVTPYIGGTAQPVRTFNSTATSQVITGLTNGTAYTFRVRAVNAIGDGTLSAASAAVTPTATPAPYAPYSSWTHLVDQVHRQLIGRLPTTAERNQWVSALQGGGSTPGDLVSALRQSSHHRTIVDQVTRLYMAYYLRIPDKAGLEYWIGQRLGGQSLVSISAFFARSNEFKVLYGSKTNQEFVELIYQNILGRPGEPGGITYWTGEINSGRRSRGEVMVGFSESAEYKDDQAAEVTVSVLYILWVDRVPTIEELDAGIDALEGGQSVADYADTLLPKAAILP